MKRFLISAWCSLILVVTVSAEPTTEEWNKVTDKAIEFLKSTQNADGSWGPDDNPQKRGITGIVLTGLLRTGKVSPTDPMAAKALKFIESLVNVKEGHIAGNDARIGLQNYVTSVNVMALQTANQPDKYKSIIGDAAKFLKKLQWDDSEGKKKEDDFFGGAGYDSKSRPDLSNTHFFIDALHDAGIPTDDAAFKNALIFVSRCQNFKSENNDMPWAGKINDGSFIYSAAGGGSTKTSDAANAPLTGYGSMTYAGIKSMIYCGVSKDDPRIKKALEWISKNYTVDANPGMPPELSQRGLYYYYHTMAKALSVVGIDELEDDKKVKHDWKKDLTQALSKRQKADGSWTNPTDRWMEGNPQLVTGYALMALSYTKPKK